MKIRLWEAELNVLFLSNKYGIYSEVYSRNTLCFGPDGLDLGQALNHCTEWDYTWTESYTAAGWWRMCHTALLMLQWAQKEMWWRQLPNTNPECLEMRSTWDLKPRILWGNTASAQNRFKQIHTECNTPILSHVLEFDYMWVTIRRVIWSPKELCNLCTLLWTWKSHKGLIQEKSKQYNQSMQNSLRQSSNIQIAMGFSIHKLGFILS